MPCACAVMRTLPFSISDLIPGPGGRVGKPFSNRMRWVDSTAGEGVSGTAVCFDNWSLVPFFPAINAYTGPSRVSSRAASWKRSRSRFRSIARNCSAVDPGGILAVMSYRSVSTHLGAVNW